MCCHNPTGHEFNSLRPPARCGCCPLGHVKTVVRAVICPRPDCRRPRLLPEPHGHRCRSPRPSPAVAVLKRKRARPPLHTLDRLFWTVLRVTWSRWKDGFHCEIRLNTRRTASGAVRPNFAMKPKHCVHTTLNTALRNSRIAGCGPASLAPGQLNHHQLRRGRRS